MCTAPANNADLIKPASVLLPAPATVRKSPNGPHTATTRAAHASRGGQRRQRVRRLPHAEDRADHRRRERAQPHLPFISPALTDSLKVPNPCTACHKDKTTKWALEELKLARVLAMARGATRSSVRSGRLQPAGERPPKGGRPPECVIVTGGSCRPSLRTRAASGSRRRRRTAAPASSGRRRCASPDPPRTRC